MRSNAEDETPLVRRLRLVIRRSEQPIIAGLVGISLIAMAIYFWSQSFVRSGLINIDQAAPREQHFLVDLNSASWPELANLPGIGETFARSIVQYRERHGPFGSHQELMNISGIGPVKLKKLRTYLSPLPISPSPQPDSP